MKDNKSKFGEYCSAYFGYLVREFGFEESEISMVTHGFEKNYCRSDMIVTVGREADAWPYLNVVYKGDGVFSDASINASLAKAMRSRDGKPVCTASHADMFGILARELRTKLDTLGH